MIECVHCKKPITGGGAVICPYYKGAIICMKHCYECKHGRDWLSGERRCGYYWNDKPAINAARQTAIEVAERAVKEFTA